MPSSARPWPESTRVHSDVDRLDADGTRVSGQESTNPATRPHLKKHLHGTAPLQWRSEIMSATGVARSDEEDHARDSARSRAEHLLWAMAGGKRRCLRASTHRPLPIMGSLRAPESWPLTLRSEISQGIARRSLGNLSVDQKEKSARLAKGRACRDEAACRLY